MCLLRGTFYVLPIQCIYVFCVDLRTNSDYFTVQHQLTGFYNRDGVCLLRRTYWVLKFNLSQRSVERFTVRRSGVRMATVPQTEESRFESWQGAEILFATTSTPVLKPPILLSGGLPWSVSVD